MRVILHVDMDAFFASVELLRHPEWRGKPVIVGAGPHERGVVSTCSYEARRYGVHSAMPSRTAYAKCPHAIFVSPNLSRYHEVSQTAFEVFARFSPYVEAVSIDEAFLDITGSLAHFSQAHENLSDLSNALAAAKRLGEALRADIRTQCGVTCSVGIAPNRLLAKLGSECHKPDGLTLVPFESEAIINFLAPRALSDLWGVGEKTAALLRPYGLLTCGDIQHLVRNDQLAQLNMLLGETAASAVAAYAFGRADDTVHWQATAEKSVSREYTFETDESNWLNVRKKLLELVQDVGRRFRRETRWAQTAKLKIRDAAFVTITRQIPLAPAARDDMAFRQAALTLFNHETPRTVRLIGFGVTHLRDTPDDAPLTLFETPDTARREKHERLSAVLDRLHQQGLL